MPPERTGSNRSIDVVASEENETPEELPPVSMGGGRRDRHDRVGGLLNPRVGHRLDSDVMLPMPCQSAPSYLPEMSLDLCVVQRRVGGTHWRGAGGDQEIGGDQWFRRASISSDLDMSDRPFIPTCLALS